MGSDSELGGCATCIKWSIFVFNILLWAAGTALLGLGIWLYVEFGQFLDDLAGFSWLSAPIVIMVVGAIMVVVCFFGCCGAFKESKCMLYIFASSLVVIVILEIAGGAVGYVKRNDVEDVLESSLSKSMSEYNTSVPIQKAWDYAQKTFKCCGSNSSDQWASIPGFGSKIPWSCCNTAVKNFTCPTSMTFTPTNVNQYYPDGCYPTIRQKILDNVVPVMIAAIALGCIELCGIIFGFWLACQID
ncbi:leukocyte surface antigen CD53-like [Oscarella lobularis]|uniref:leukocyte surface antigen CD53-like n=1 Tax=Oscarella lobularis TaxID=121494 RepID=UPI003313C407